MLQSSLRSENIIGYVLLCCLVGTPATLPMTSCRILTIKDIATNINFLSFFVFVPTICRKWLHAGKIPCIKLNLNVLNQLNKLHGRSDVTSSWVITV